MKTKSTTLGATGCGSHWRLWKVVASVILSTFLSFNAIAQCDPPTGIAVTVLSNSQAQVNWTNPPGTLWINLEYRELPSGTFSSPLTAAAPATSLQLTGLNSGTNYEVRMLSKCAGNTQSAYSTPVPFTTMASNPCGTVSIVVGNSTNTTTSISWATISGATYYRVRKKLSSSMTWDPIVTTSSTSMTFNSLTPASEYDVQVQTVCALPVVADWSEIAVMETCDPNNLTTVSESACDSYTWGLNGQTYTASGVYSYTGSYPNSCPKYYVLNLTITPSAPYPTLECYENATFNSSTCSWDISGSQPAMPPMVNCWDNFVFNTTSCQWDNTGSQPAMPPMVNCWDNFVFNTTSCAWDNTGSQPAMPPMVNCWDNFVFNTTSCAWDNTGSQPAQPPVVNCWDNFVFNTTSCAWDNTGSQPAMPPMVNCWDNFVFNTTSCAWDNTGSQPAMPPMVNCWDNFVFNTTSCAWDNTGSQPAMPPMVNCWDNFVFNTTSCAWDNTGSQPAMPPMVNCWDNFVFNTTSCAWDNTGSQPAMPPMVNCWDNFVFNTTSCAWDNTGSQPAQPPVVNCWDNFVFNTTSCAWDNTGSQPAMPPMVNCWDNFVFNTTSCAWDNTGSQPAMPTGLLCYQSAVFNNSSCSWDIVGSIPYNVIPASACVSYSWNGNTYTASGMYTHNVLNTNPCGYDVLDLTINPLPTVIAQDFSACPNTTINIAPFVSPAPSVGSTFMPSNPYNGPGGLYTYTYVDPVTGCSASASGTITRTNSIAITGLTVTNTTNNTASVVWNAVPGASWYTLRYNNGSGWQYATSSTPNILLTGLLSGTYYDLEARANCSVLNPGAYLAYTNFSTVTTCFPVTNLAATPVAGSNGTKLNVTFTNPNNSGWCLLNYSTSPSGPWIPYSPANPAGATLIGLSPNTLYYIRVQAKCNALDVSSSVLITQSTSGNPSKGIEETIETSTSDVSIYPNPTRDVLNIEVTSAENASTEVKVFDMSGRLVKQVQANTEVGVNNLVIDLNDVSKGMYTLQVFENNKLTKVTKVSKQD